WAEPRCFGGIEPWRPCRQPLRLYALRCCRQSSIAVGRILGEKRRGQSSALAYHGGHGRPDPILPQKRALAHQVLYGGRPLRFPAEGQSGTARCAHGEGVSAELPRV